MYFGCYNWDCMALVLHSLLPACLAILNITSCYCVVGKFKLDMSKLVFYFKEAVPFKVYSAFHMYSLWWYF